MVLVARWQFSQSHCRHVSFKQNQNGRASGMLNAGGHNSTIRTAFLKARPWSIRVFYVPYFYIFHCNSKYIKHYKKWRLARILGPQDVRTEQPQPPLLINLFSTLGIRNYRWFCKITPTDLTIHYYYYILRTLPVGGSEAILVSFWKYHDTSLKWHFCEDLTFLKSCQKKRSKESA